MDFLDGTKAEPNSTKRKDGVSEVLELNGDPGAIHGTGLNTKADDLRDDSYSLKNSLPTRGSRGMPSARSAMMLRWIWLEPA